MITNTPAERPVHALAASSGDGLPVPGTWRTHPSRGLKCKREAEGTMEEREHAMVDKQPSKWAHKKKGSNRLH